MVDLQEPVAKSEIQGVVSNPPHMVPFIVRAGIISPEVGTEWAVKTQEVRANPEQARGGGADTELAMPLKDVMALFHAGKLTLAEDNIRKPKVDDFLNKYGLTKEMLKPRD